MVTARISFLAVAGICPPFREYAQAIFLTFCGAIEVIRAKVVIVPDRISRLFADDLFKPIHGAEHVVIIAQQCGVRGVAVVVIAEHQQEIEVTARCHFSERGGRQMPALPDA